MDSIFIDILKAQGLAGVVIFALGVAVQSLFKLFAKVQEKRIAEAHLIGHAIDSNTALLEQLRELLRDQRRA